MGSRLAVAAVVLLVLVAWVDALRTRGGPDPEPAVPPPAAPALPRTTLESIILADLNGTLTRQDVERLRLLCDEPRACGPIPNETGTDP